MGYTFTWDDIEKACRKLGMKRQGKTAVWKGIGPDGVKRTCIIHAKHKGIVAETSNDIDIHSTSMAAHLEGAESIPLTPELEEIIKDGITESRQLEREREAKLEQQKKEDKNMATTDNE